MINGKNSSGHKNGNGKKSVQESDIEFMNSLNAAVLQKSPIKMSLILYVIAALMIVLFAWAYFTELDELTRGIGKVIPSRQVQIVQNLEGGIVKELLVKEGQFVKAGQVLVVIDDTGAGSSYQEGLSKLGELKARAVRLRAEAGIAPFVIDEEAKNNYPQLIMEEQRLYETNTARKNSEKEVFIQRFKQRQVDLANARLRLKNLHTSKGMTQREIELMEPLFKKGLVSELEFIQLRQKELDNRKELDETGKSIESLGHQVIEAKNAVSEIEGRQKSEAQTELNKVIAEIEQISNTQVAIEDRVKRTMVRSPVDGTVKQLLINTVGGIAKPGMDIIEIVPNDDTLLIEAKIKPSDIAFIYPGQNAVVKLTAYDFAIYGGLEGKVIHVSADTITDEKDEEFYLVRIETDKNYLGTEDNKKDIMVGMTVQADIITGKKTIIQYIMKPILRAKYNALRER
ncbi:HlyD family type I secretion periplasmic adaptor subunit [Geovibrio thiophilus]|uniref:HlyD family type I secretion periplasmic adaptor subunit n=1 Tax=Geovibrio thiophilus TaxID=139438 RepID=A0A3R5UZ36_9BACT|nr:HlyD family type I secretion periplasmic adaptor subunit [Geovibrio thiophilus]QAR33329.1 HlyD family type I secretion periplasmic adaptor subunit [Geovibrio thiophilus]